MGSETSRQCRRSPDTSTLRLKIGLLGKNLQTHNLLEENESADIFPVFLLTGTNFTFTSHYLGLSLPIFTWTFCFHEGELQFRVPKEGKGWCSIHGVVLSLCFNLVEKNEFFIFFLSLVDSLPRFSIFSSRWFRTLPDSMSRLSSMTLLQGTKESRLITASKRIPKTTDSRSLQHKEIYCPRANQTFPCFLNSFPWHWHVQFRKLN